jgi:acyl-CoA thioester hydrolase
MIDVLFAIKELSIKYVFPARLDDYLAITTEIGDLTATSFLFRQTIKNQNDEIVCGAVVKVVCVNSKLKLQRVPDTIKALINAIMSDKTLDSGE